MYIHMSLISNNPVDSGQVPPSQIRLHYPLPFLILLTVYVYVCVILYNCDMASRVRRHLTYFNS